MPTYTNRASFSSRPNFKLDIEAVENNGSVTVRAYAVRTGTETTTPFANSGSGATRGYSFTNSSSPTSGSAEWVFDFRPAGSSSSSNPYSVDVWGSGITRTISGTSTITVSASMSLLGSASVSVNVPLSASPPVISGSFANATRGVAGYSSSVSATNSPTSWSRSGSLPPGLSGSGSGGTYTITGTPTTSGTYNFSLTATNSGGSDTENFSIVVSDPPAAPVWTLNFPAGTVGVSYTGTGSVSSSAFSSWGFDTYTPVPGLNLSYPNLQSFTLSSVPTTAGTYTSEVSATDDFGQTTTASFSVVISNPVNPSWENKNNFATGKVNSGYYATRKADNATSVTGTSTNAPGLTATSGTVDGKPAVILSGTPTAAGTYSVSATANGSAGTTADSLNVSVVINPLVPPTWSDTSLSGDFRVGTSYATSSGGNNSVSATNATSFSIVSGSLPAGISGSTSGSTYTLSGTPTTAAPYSFTLRASNGDGNASPDQNFSGTVVPAVLVPPTWSDTSLSTDFRVGSSYATTSGGNNSVSATNATSFSVVAGALPAGISGSTSGSTYTLSGTPTTRGSYTFTLRASNADGNATPDQTFSGTVTQLPAWTDETLGGFNQGRAYSDSLSVSTATAVTWTVSAGSLPAGIITTTSGTNTNTLNFSGTPTGTGTYNFTITANNGDGTLSKSFSGNILLPPNWTDNQLGSFIEGNPYSDSVVATNSPTYALTGTLPTGISHSNGLVTGTPTTVGQSYNFTITASNADGSVSQTFTGTVQPDLGGGIKVYSGTAWDNKEIYAYDGTTWVKGTVYMFNGSIWAKSVF